MNTQNAAKTETKDADTKANEPRKLYRALEERERSPLSPKQGTDAPYL